MTTDTKIYKYDDKLFLFFVAPAQFSPTVIDVGGNIMVEAVHWTSYTIESSVQEGAESFRNAGGKPLQKCLYVCVVCVK
jgi:hypothetical protein